MKTFDHRDDGQSEAVWRRDGRWELTQPLALRPGTGLRRVVVLAAHPDDETLGAAGLLSAAQQVGIEAYVVVATDGERSHPRSPTHTPARLAQVRRSEVAAAVDRVAPGAAVDYLGLPDGGLAGARDELMTRVCAAVGDLSVGALLVAPWRQDGHPDHDVLGSVAADVAERTGALLLEYPIWAWHWADPGELPWSQLRVLSLDESTRTAKVDALQHHRTQVQPLSPAPGDEVLLSASMIEHFSRDRETFIDAAGAWEQSVFERLHRVAGDPWAVLSSDYEQGKRDRTIAALPRTRFSRAFEPGCSIGVLTRDLAAHCDELVAVDVSPTAVEQATRRTAGLPGVEVSVHQVPDWWPDGSFDLVVLSEVCYFLDPVALHGLMERTRRSLRRGGFVLLCNWRHPIDGWAVDAAEVHCTARRVLGLPVQQHIVETDYLLEVFGPCPG